MHASSIIAIGAIAYVAILVGISAFASRRIRNSADFIVAGRQLPLGMAIFTGAMFSALMSSADGGMLAPASIFAQNILKVLKSRVEEETVLRATRYSVFAVGVLGLCTALFFQNVYQLMVKSFSILMVGLFVPMTAAIYWKKANQAGAVASMTSGVLSWLMLEYVNITSAAPPLPSELIAAGVGLVVLPIVTLLSHRSDPPKPSTDINGEKVDMTGRLGILAPPGPGRQRT